MAALFSSLSRDAAIVLLRHVVATANVAQLLRLAAACTQTLQLVSHADWFWQQQCEGLGWLRLGVCHPPRTLPSPAARQCGADTPLHGIPPPLVARATSTLWFEYFCLRMSCRWRLRTLTRKYVAFLNIHSRLALQQGASIEQLEAAQARMGAQLPFEVWELYRFRAGQAPGTAVTFAGACRLLELPELHVVQLEAAASLSLAPEAPPTQQQQLAGVQAQLPLLSVTEPATASAHDTPHRTDSSMCAAKPVLGAEAAASRSATTPGVVFLSTTTGSPAYAAACDSSVFIVNGFTCCRAAGSVSALIQLLLT